MIQIGPVALTILHIPVIIAAILFQVEGGLIVGLTFGLTSWFVAATRAATPIDLLFVNPLVSVLPRVLFGIAAGLLAQWSVKIKHQAVRYGGLAFFSTLLHSLLVYTCLYFNGKELFFPNSDLSGVVANYVPFVIGAFTVNSLIEAAVAAFIGIVLMKALERLAVK
ncbi:hypothetical protein SDC9_169627 [bioreactor metagenome]|uniref:ECF transporter S component n=1 Tax=bioreactor metagenome TaxID=1076179 RepID=A0A645GE12_9ZZZZ